MLRGAAATNRSTTARAVHFCEESWNTDNSAARDSRCPCSASAPARSAAADEFFKAWGASDVAEATRLVDVCLEAGLTMFDSRRRLFRRAWPRRSSGRPSRAAATRCSSPPRRTFRTGPRPERRRLVALSPHPGGRGQPAAAGHRLHRSLPAARLRRADADRGNAAHARRPRARGQDPLHRLLELLRLAPDEVARVSEQLRPAALRRAPGLLLAGRPRLRMGADAAGARSESRRGGVEPARLGPPHRQDPPRPAAARQRAACRASRRRRRPAGAGRVPLQGRRRARRGRAARPARRCRRSRSTGCCSGRRWRPSSSARATRSNCGRTSARSAGTSRRTRSPSSTPRARRRWPIPTGTSAASPSATRFPPELGVVRLRHFMASAKKKTSTTAKAPKAPEEILAFASPAEWARWLEANHKSSPAVYLRLAKGESKSLGYVEALDVALMWGWIDSQTRPLDAAAYLRRFSARTSKSPWSKINCAKAEALIEAGKMKAPGLAEIERAKADGRWERAYDGARASTVPEDLASALAKNAKARTFFEKLDGANRYAILWRLQTARRRQKRGSRGSRSSWPCARAASEFTSPRSKTLGRLANPSPCALGRAWSRVRAPYHRDALSRTSRSPGKLSSWRARRARARLPALRTGCAHSAAFGLRERRRCSGAAGDPKRRSTRPVAGSFQPRVHRDRPPRLRWGAPVPALPVADRTKPQNRSAASSQPAG